MTIDELISSSCHKRQAARMFLEIYKFCERENLPSGFYRFLFISFLLCDKGMGTDAPVWQLAKLSKLSVRTITSYLSTSMQNKWIEVDTTPIGRVSWPKRYVLFNKLMNK